MITNTLAVVHSGIAAILSRFDDLRKRGFLSSARRLVGSATGRIAYTLQLRATPRAIQPLNYPTREYANESKIVASNLY